MIPSQAARDITKSKHSPYKSKIAKQLAKRILTASQAGLWDIKYAASPLPQELLDSFDSLGYDVFCEVDLNGFYEYKISWKE